MPQKSLGSALNDAFYDRHATLLPTVPVHYKGEQAAAADYTLFLHDDDRHAPQWTDKDGDGNDYVLVLQLWGSNPRTLLNRAKTIIESVSATPLTIAGFDFMRSEIEMNRAMPDLQTDGQENEYARMLQIRFFYRPS